MTPKTKEKLRKIIEKVVKQHLYIVEQITRSKGERLLVKGISDKLQDQALTAIIELWEKEGR